MPTGGATTLICDICGYREADGVYAMQFMPLSLAKCRTCLEHRAFPEQFVSSVLGHRPDDEKRRRYFEEHATVPQGADYRRLTPEELDTATEEGRRRWEARKAEKSTVTWVPADENVVSIDQPSRGNRSDPPPSA